LDDTGPLGRGQSEEERNIAQQAAIQAALMNADLKNAQGYQGKTNLKPSSTDSNTCYYLTAIESADIPSDHIVDTTGAGDAFIGSMVYSVAMGMPPIKGCELGSLVAACKCTMLGARPGLPKMDSIQFN
jgi:sugar/nucleoside kinase (ribokinase family)